MAARSDKTTVGGGDKIVDNRLTTPSSTTTILNGSSRSATSAASTTKTTDTNRYAEAGALAFEGKDDEKEISRAGNETEPQRPRDNIDSDSVARVIRKIDKFLIPAMICGHGLVYYDKSIIGSAVLFGMTEDLNLFVYDYSTDPPTLDSSRLSWSISIFYLGMLAGLYPMTFAIQRFKIRTVLGPLVLLWAATCMSTAATTTYQGLYVQRFFLGFIESVIPTAFMTIVSVFYTQREQSFRQSLWFSSTGLFTIIGSALNYGFAQIEGGALRGWQYIYLLAGSLTFCFGIWCFFVPSEPAKASFLTQKEREIAVERLRVGYTGVRCETLKLYQIKEALVDIKMWLIFIMMTSAYVTNGAVTGFGPLLVTLFGYSSLDAILLQFPVGGISFIFILLTGYLGSRYRNIRVLMLILCCLPVFVGVVLIWKSSWYYHAAAPIAGYALVGFFGPVVCLIITLGMTNVAGHTKRSMMAANIYVAYCVGNIVGPQLVNSSTLDQHYPELWEAIIICYCITIVCSVIFYFMLTKENRRREAMDLNEADKSRMVFEDLTDKENLFFRYVL